MSFAVRHYFSNGGSDALIVRVHNGALASRTPAAPGPLQFEATDPGTWGNRLRLRVNHDIEAELANLNPPNLPNTLFNLSVKDLDPVPSRPTSMSPSPPVTRASLPRCCASRAACCVGYRISARGRQRMRRPAGQKRIRSTMRAPRPYWGDDGNAVGAAHIAGPGLSGSKRGLYRKGGSLQPARDHAEPARQQLGCTARPQRELEGARGGLLRRPPGVLPRRPVPRLGLPSDLFPPAPAAEQLANYVSPIGSDSKPYAGLYMPYLQMTDPLTGAPAAFPPSACDRRHHRPNRRARGVWKAPAGLEAGLNGVLELTSNLNDGENGTSTRSGSTPSHLPGRGHVVWGARTLRGADTLASEWKYVPVRRLALFLEESLYRGTQWVVFEPNDEPLWAQIRLNIGAFMQNLFRQGAFQGSTPRDAYFVKCDSETTTQNDINLGIVNILVGFAPLKPAEFVVIQIQQIAGQIDRPEARSTPWHSSASMRHASIRTRTSNSA